VKQRGAPSRQGFGGVKCLPMNWLPIRSFPLRTRGLLPGLLALVATPCLAQGFIDDQPGVVTSEPTDEDRERAQRLEQELGVRAKSVRRISLAGEFEPYAGKTLALESEASVLFDLVIERRRFKTRGDLEDFLGVARD